MSHTGPSIDNHDRRRPVTTEERLLSTNTQPRLVDLASKNISTGDLPTSTIPYKPKPENPYACTKNRKTKTKQLKKTTSTGSNTGRDQKLHNLKAGRKTAPTTGD